jgi:enediyne biosynthesis protein E3
LAEPFWQVTAPPSPSAKRHPSELKGFAYEGAAMGMALLDGLLPWRRPRLGKFVAGSADRHIYVAHVGAGWAIARLPFGAKRILRQLDPLLQSLAFDGYGFHQVYFAGAADFQSQTAPPTFDRNAHRAFDQGLVCGRPLLDFSEQRPDQKRRRPRR